MAVIRPFRALRPANTYTETFAALPYDVYTREEAAAAVRENPSSFLAIDRPETAFSPKQNMYDDIVYKKAEQLFRGAIQEERLIRDGCPCFYLYSLTMNGHTQTGLVACSAVDDYINGTIRRHENTRADKEKDRIRHIDALSAQTGPIFLTYRPRPSLRSLFRKIRLTKCLFDFTSEDHVRHQGWRIDNPGDIAQITEQFAAVDSTYIADGHHRAASAVRVSQMRRLAYPTYTGDEEFNYFLSVLFPSDELTIMDYNRIVYDRNGLSAQSILEKIEKNFTVTDTSREPVHPSRKGVLSMYMDGMWYVLQFRQADKETSGRPLDPASADPVLSLDVSILQNTILAPLFNIKDPKTDPRIAFAGGIRGLSYLQEQADLCDGLAFAMFPTSMEELLHVADAGKLMPPKSTWFEPKLRSGLFIHSFES